MRLTPGGWSSARFHRVKGCWSVTEDVRRQSMKKFLLFAVAFAFVTGNAWAQGATPAPLAKVTVSPEVAKRTLMKAVINADTAKAIVDSCVDWTKQQGGNVSVAVFILS